MSRNISRTTGKDQVLTDTVQQSPVDKEQLRLRRWISIIAVVVLVIVIVGLWLIIRFSIDRPVDYADIGDHFKYGSIGAEPGGSLTNTVGGLLPPYWIFRAMPKVCPEMLPPGGLAALGVLIEEGMDRPIGVSRRYRLGIDFAGFNCAICHTGTYRETPQSQRQIVLGMPSHQLDFQALTRLIVDCPMDARFTAQNVLARIKEVGGNLGWFDRLLYRFTLIPRTRTQTMVLGSQIKLLLDGSTATAWGRGRVDTFNPYKALQFNWNLNDLPRDELTSASDFPSLWNQKPREGMYLHWDGNNDSVDERNLSASLGAGVTPVTIDHKRLKRVADWALTLPPPAYPFAVNQDLAARGKALYAQYCTDCHADHSFRDGQ
ncbi:MAG: cytochrome c, partial [Candidatus Tectomicrobia bacterium]|nr:cytochrome c [Candidatus Tectomicrobia bacterium]